MIEKKRRVPDLIDYLFLILLAYNIAPIVPRIISVSVTTYFYLGVQLVAILFVLARNRGSKLERYLTFLIPFVIWKVYMYFVSSDTMIAWVYSVILDFTVVLVGANIIHDRKNSVTLFFWGIIVLFTITAITSIIYLIDDPTAARFLATSPDADDARVVEYNWKNIGGYEFTYLFVLSYPLIILATKKKKLNPWLAAAFSVLMLVYIFYSEYTTALLMFMITSMFWFFKKDLKPRTLVFLFIIALVSILFFYSIFGNILNWLADVINSKEISPRLRALAGGVEGLEGFEDNRLGFYMASLTTFFSNPILGAIIGGGSVGGHSFILDFLAMYGLIGGAILFGIYWIVYKWIFYPFRRCYGYGYVIWTFAQTVFLSLVNTSLWLVFLCFISAVFFKYIFTGEVNDSSLDS